MYWMVSQLSNVTLNKSRSAVDNDSWYTPYDLVETEVGHYTQYFTDKHVVCNADDPLDSAFTCYFTNNFHKLGLKALTCVAYAKSRLSETHHYKCNYLEKLNEAGMGYILEKDRYHTALHHLKSDGSFMDPEVVKYWEEADIICTNPPFSQFKEFYKRILYYQKSYLIIANMNVLSHQNVFPEIQNDRARVGYKFGAMKFRVPLDYLPSVTRDWIDEKGQRWKSLGNTIWLTDLPVHREESLVLTQSYDPERYPKYDGYDAIHVDKTVNIPMDYPGVMGVPISYMKYHDPQRFELVGEANHGKDNPYDLFGPYLHGKRMFKRLLIRHR